jgi:hypothetical protein
MTGKNEGVVGSIVEKVGRWIEKYEEAVREERELEKQLRQIERLLKETENAAYVIDVTKLQQQKKENEEKLKAVKQKRLKLEWLAGVKIKRGEWNPEFLKEYEFIRDLGLLNKIRKEQTEHMCNNCSECTLIRVRTPKGDLSLEAVVKSKGIPYLPIYKLVEIRDRQREMEVKERFLGALSDEERKEIEKRIGEKMVLNRNILNCFLTEKRVPLSEKVVLKHWKYGCHRKLPRWLPIITNTETDIDGDPKAPDHFVEDITASLGEDGSYSHIYLSQKHGSEETEQ